MPIQAPQWTEFLSCPVCCNKFNAEARGPVTLGCGHSICRGCLTNLHRKQCPFDQSLIRFDVSKIPPNLALMRLVGGVVHEEEIDKFLLPPSNAIHYLRASRCIQDLALYLKPFPSGTLIVLSKPMQKKLVTLVNCQLLVTEGRARALRAARSLGERTVTELLLQHQSQQQLSANLWAAVRARGCIFLGPAMQEEVLKLVLLALEDGSALSRKVLVMFVVQRLEPHYSQASKTSIGHVIQLLYRASCYKVSKREGDSSLMQLKEEFRTYEALRREHDAQIVQIANEAGLRIAPDQWSALLYGDTSHKSHMQSIMDKLQTPQSFSQSVQELIMALQRSGDPGHVSYLRGHLELLANIDPGAELTLSSMEETADALEAARAVVAGLADFLSQHGNRRHQEQAHSANRYKNSSVCRDLAPRGQGARGGSYNFGHSEIEADKFRGRNRKIHNPETNVHREPNILPAVIPNSPATPVYEAELFTQTLPSNVYVAVHNFHPLGNGIAPDPYRPPSENSTHLHHPNDISRLRLNKSEILVPGGNPIPEQEDLSSFEPNMASKFGPICRQSVHNLTYEETPQCAVGPVRKPNAAAAAAAAAVAVAVAPPPPPPPHWFGRPTNSLLSIPEVDPNYVNQQSQSLMAESQRVKQQLRNLEKKILDLKLTDVEDARQSQLVDEIRRIQEGLRDEEVYEAGLAEDMKVLEQRWESEFAEQERRWSESDARPLN